MPKQDYLSGLGIEPQMTLEEVAVAIAKEEGAEKPLTRQRIRAIEQSALKKLRESDVAKEVFELYMRNE